MTRRTGFVPGAAPAEQAAALAGALARLGITTVHLRVAGIARTLTVRETDLPGELLRAPVGSVLMCPDHGLEFVTESPAISWYAAHPGIAERLTAAFARMQ